MLLYIFVGLLISLPYTCIIAAEGFVKLKCEIVIRILISLE